MLFGIVVTKCLLQKINVINTIAYLNLTDLMIEAQSYCFEAECLEDLLSSINLFET